LIAGTPGSFARAGAAALARSPESRGGAGPADPARGGRGRRRGAEARKGPFS
ncbi:hypothetical protein P7K49_007131, partial [Saguinus oedipus]